MPYASLPGGALDALMKRDFAPKTERLRSLVARLRGVPAVFAAGKANVKNPPKEFTDLGDPHGQGLGRLPRGRGGRLGERRRRRRRRAPRRVRHRAKGRARRQPRLRDLAGERSPAALEGLVRARRRDVHQEARHRRHGRDAARRAPRQGRGAARQGPRGVRRHREEDRRQAHAPPGHGAGLEATTRRPTASSPTSRRASRRRGSSSSTRTSSPSRRRCGRASRRRRPTSAARASRRWTRRGRTRPARPRLSIT